jgi:glycosyltransferase involved in cell wall biosynthesis
MKPESTRVVFVWLSMRSLSGVTTWLNLLLGRLSDCGIDASVVEFERWSGQPYTDPRVPAGKVVYGGPRPWHTPTGYHRQVLRKILRRRPHAVVFSDQWGWKFSASLAGRVPLVNVAHIDSTDPDYWRRLQAGAARMAALVGVSDQIAGRLRALPGAPEVFSIPSGIEVPERWPDRLRPDTDGPHLLYVGRLDRRQKRVQDLVPFVRSAAAAWPGFRLVIVGDGPERGWLEQELRWASPRVVLTGAVDRHEVFAHYSRSHFLLQFSQFEGLSMALLEGMARGTVPVVTDIPSGVGQVMQHGANGFLFPVGQPDAAVRAIAQAVPRWPSLAEAAQRTVKANFGVDLMARRYAAVFHKVGMESTSRTVPYVDETYTQLKGRVARELLPLPVYCGLLGRAL